MRRRGFHCRPRTIVVSLSLGVLASFLLVATQIPHSGGSPEFSAEAWRAQHAPTGSRLHTALLAEDAVHRILSQPPSAVPTFSHVDRTELGQTLASGLLYVDRGAPLQNLFAIDWACDAHGDYYATQLHALTGIASLLASLDKLDIETERRISTVIHDWMRSNATPPGQSDRAWYEGTVVKRLCNLLHALNYLRRHQALEGLSPEDLLTLIAQHALYLFETPDIYLPGNHGIRQDMTLAAVAIALPDLPESDAMIALAER